MVNWMTWCNWLRRSFSNALLDTFCFVPQQNTRSDSIVRSSEFDFCERSEVKIKFVSRPNHHAKKSALCFLAWCGRSVALTRQTAHHIFTSPVSSYYGAYFTAESPEDSFFYAY